MVDNLIEINQHDMETIKVISEFQKRKDFHEKQALQIADTISGLKAEIKQKYGEQVFQSNVRIVVI